VQAGVTAGGNDGSRFVEFGAVNIPLSWPLRYAHTAAEVADMNDIEALRRIVSVLLEQELAGGISSAAE
jgi:putative aminopeptidase FrvX